MPTGPRWAEPRRAGRFNRPVQDGHRIRRVDPAGRITTIAGNGTRRPSGDGGPAGTATLNYPSDLAYGPAGLYILDGGEVRRTGLDGVITSVAELPGKA